MWRVILVIILGIMDGGSNYSCEEACAVLEAELVRIEGCYCICKDPLHEFRVRIPECQMRVCPNW